MEGSGSLPLSAAAAENQNRSRGAAGGARGRGALRFGSKIWKWPPGWKSFSSLPTCSRQIELRATSCTLDGIWHSTDGSGKREEPQ